MIPPTRDAWTRKLALGTVLLLGLFLRVRDLDATSFWGDEIHTVSRASSLHGVVVRARLSPLYILTHILLFFGDSELWIRLPHAIIGVLGIALLYRVAAEWIGARAGLLAAFLLAISPFHVFHSREARYYSLVVFFSLLSAAFLQKLYMDEKRTRWLAAFAGSAALAAHNHLFTLIAIGALGLTGIILEIRRAPGRTVTQAPRRPYRRAILWTGASLAIAALLYFSYPERWQSLWHSLLGASRAENRFGLELDAAFFHNLGAWLGGGPGLPAIVCFLFFALGIAAAWSRSKPAFILFIAFVVFTFAALKLAIHLGPSHRFYIRYLIFLLPFYLLGVALGVESVLCWLVRRMGENSPSKTSAHGGSGVSLAWIAAPAVLFALLQFPALRHVYAYHHADIRGAIARVASLDATEDLVAIPALLSQGDQSGFIWYHDRAPGIAARLVVARSLEALRAAAGEHPRTWFVDMEPPDSKPELRALREWVRKNWVEVDRLPHAVHSHDLGPPVVALEMVIWRSP